MQKMGILKATIWDLGKWRQSHLLSSMRPFQSRFNSFMKLATNYRKKGASLALCKITTAGLQDAWQRFISVRPNRTSASILEKQTKNNVYMTNMCAKMDAAMNISCDIRIIKYNKLVK